MSKPLKKLKSFLKFLLSLVPEGDPDEYNKRKYRAERDGYRKYSR